MKVQPISLLLHKRAKVISMIFRRISKFYFVSRHPSSSLVRLALMVLVLLSGVAAYAQPADENYQDNTSDASLVVTSRTVDGILYTANVTVNTAVATSAEISRNFFPSGDRHFSFDPLLSALATTVSIESSDGSAFKLVSLDASVFTGLAGNRTEDFTITGFDVSDVQVASDNIDFTTSDASGSITYTKDASGAEAGTLTFNTDWENIKRITFTGTSSGVGTTNAVSIAFDNIDFDAAVAGGDSTPPEVTSITRQSPTDENTNAASVTFRVTFDEDVQNVSTDGSDFAISGAGAGGTASITGASSVSASIYDVTVATINTDGLLDLGFAGGQDIQDLATNAFGGTNNGTEQTYTIDQTGATTTTPDLATSSDSGNEEHTAGATSDNRTNDLTPTFEGTTEVGASVVVTSSVAGSLGSATVDGSGNWTLTPMSDLAVGAHTITAQATDALGNTGAVSGGLAIILDNTSPTVTITSTESPGPTNSNPIPLTVTFSEEAENMKENDFVVSGGTTSNFVGPDSTTFTVDITPAMDGTVTVDLNAGRAFDLAGNPNTAATQFSIVYDGTQPTISSVAVEEDNIYVDVTFSEGVYNTNGGSGALQPSDFDLKLTGGVATSPSISSVKKNDNAVEGSATALAGGETVVRVFFSVTGTPNGSETLEVDLASSAVFDEAGNEADADQSANSNTANLNVPDDESNIIVDNTLTKQSNFNPIVFDAADLDNTGDDEIEIARFTLQDGGSDNTDADSKSTIISSITLTVSNPDNIARIALYDGSGEVGEGTLSSGSITFSGVTITAADNMTETLRVFATFKDNGTVVDGEAVAVTIDVSALTTAAGSTLASAFTGGSDLQDAPSSDENRIEVDGTNLSFTVNVSDTEETATMSPSPQVSLIDADGNLDTDNSGGAGTVNITSNGTLDSSPKTATLSSGVATFNDIVHTAVATGRTLTAAASGVTGTTSAAFAVTAVDNESNIIVDAGLTKTSNFNPTTFDAADLDDTGDDELEIARFTLQDGGSDNTDADGAATVLSSITLTVSNPDNIARIALYDGSGEVGEGTLSAGSITFSGLTVTAADNMTETLSVFATFVDDGSVVDGEAVSVTIVVSALTTSSGSGLDASFTGGSDLEDANSSDENRIEVDGTTLSFTTQPTNTVQYETMTSPEVSLVDADGNVDTDNSAGAGASVSITSDGTLDSTPKTATLSSGVATFNDVVHTATATGRTLTAAASGVSAGSSTTFDITAPSAASDIIVDAGLTKSSNVNPTVFDAADLDNTGDDEVEMARFTLRDGGSSSPDADALSTILTSITLTVTNPDNIARVALYADGSEVGEGTLTAGSITFSGVTITAADNMTATLNVFATFVDDGSIVDGEAISVTIDVSALTTGQSSGLDATFTGGTDLEDANSSDENRIEVDGTNLSFTVNASDVTTNVNMSPSPEVTLVDADDNVDTDNSAGAGTVNITSNGTLDSSPKTATLTSGVATFADILHTAAATGRTLTAAASGVTGTTSSAFAVTAPNAESNIIVDAGLSKTSNFNPTTFDAADLDDTGDDELEIARFTLQDGGSDNTDSDGAPTVLTSVTLTVSNPANIARIALYDGSGEVGEGTLSAGSITFSSLTITAADEGTETLNVFATFVDDGSAVDGEAVSVTIDVSALTTGTGSGLDASFTGGSDLEDANSSDENRIEVTGTTLSFTTDASNTGENANMSPSPQVSLVDADGNVDTDNTAGAGTVNITSDGTLNSSPKTATLTSGVATFADILHTAVATGRTLTAAASGVTGTTSSTFDITDATPPEVTSIVRQSPMDATTNATSVTFRVTFNEDVTNVSTDGSDFAISGAAAGGTASIASATQITASTVFDVVVNTINTDGDLDLDFAAGQDIQDGNSNAFALAINSEQEYTIDQTAPSAFNTGTVTVNGGSVVSTFWNATNTDLDIVVPVDNDASLENGSIQLRAQINSDAFEDLGSAVTITNSDLNSTVTINILASVFENLSGGLNDGEVVTFNAIITDLAGNSTTGTASTNTITFDETAPTVSSIARNSPTAELTNATSVTFRVTFDEDVTGVSTDGSDFEISGAGAGGTASILDATEQTASTVFDVDVNSINTDGELDLDFAAGQDITDEAGNAFAVSITSEETYTIDQTAPTIAISTPIEGDGVVNASEDGDVTISGSTTGTEDGQSVSISFTDGSSTPVTGTATVTSNAWTITTDADISGLNDGTITITADVSDQAGNAATQASQTVTLDNAIPSVVVSTPSSAISVNAPNQTISGTSDEDGATINIYLDSNNDGVQEGSSLGSNVVSSGTWSISVSLTADQANDFVVQASDAAGNASSDVDVPTITEDSSDPASPVVTSPASAISVNAATQTISGTHSEDGVTVHVYADADNDGLIDNLTPLDSDVVSGGTWSVSVNLAEDDENNFIVRAEDAAGNTSGEVDVPTITEDSTAPTISISTPIEGDGIVEAAESSDVEISGTTVGVEDGQSVSVSFSDGTTTAGPVNATVTSNAWTASLADISALNDGNITVTADVSDLAGNAATQTSQTITLDQAPPTISITAPGDDVTNVDIEADITITFNENIQFGSGNILLNDLDNTTTDLTIDASSPGSAASISGAVLTIANPSGFLEEGRNYAIRIASTAIEDIGGNAFAGIADDVTYNFTTEVAPTVSIGDAAVTEGNSGQASATFTVSLDKTSPKTITIDYATSDNTATTADNDYAAVTTTTLTFNPSETSKDVTVNVNGDTRDEDAESFFLDGTNPTNASFADNQGEATITDDDDPPTVAFASTSSDGAESVSSADITVEVSTGSSKTITVDYAVTGTATGSGTDYTLADGTVTFAADDVSEIVTIASIVDDAILETNETVILTLSNPVNATLGTNTTHTYTITENDNAAVTIADASLNEADGTVTMTATLDNVVQGGFDVTITSADGTASQTDGDYTAVSETLTFAGTAGETQTFTVTVADDAILEANETITLSQGSLSTSAAVDITDGATVTINNDDNATVTIADASGNEDDGDITVTLTLDSQVDGGLTVDVSTADGTATTDDSDYTALSGETVTFTGTSGETQTVTIAATEDSKVEADETLTISMSNVTATTVATTSITTSDTGTITITNDDAAAVTIADASGDEDSGAITLTATLDNPVDGGFTVDVSTADGTATSADYTSVEGETLTFSGTAGETQTFTVTPTSDEAVESDETVTVSMSNVAGTSLSVTISDEATVTITNDDNAPVITAGQTFPIEGILSQGDEIGTVVATDADDATTFSGWTIVSGNTDDAFAIGAATGLLTVNDPTVIDLIATPSYTLTLTVSDGTNTSAEETVTIEVGDGIAPTVTLSSDVGDVTNVSPISFTATFSELVQGFTLDDLTLTNATAANLVANDAQTTYTFDLTPEAEGTVSVSIAASVANDAVGNQNEASNTISYFYDITAPTVTLTTTADAITGETSARILFDFSEVVTGFEEADIQVSSGTLSSFSGSGASYQVDITSISEGIATITVPVGAASDAAGNGNTEGSVSWEVDLTGPSGFTVTILNPAINDLNEDNFRFRINGAEPRSTFNYTINSTGGGTAVTGTGELNGNGQGGVLDDIDVSGLGDGTLTLSVEMIDEFGNLGAIATDEIQKNTEDGGSNGIAQGYSPNGDNIDDTWTIPGIEDLPNNTVTIFNRYGTKVWETTNYDNENNAWDSQANVDNIFGSAGLPDGTYFYVIEFPGTNTDSKSGFVILKR